MLHWIENSLNRKFMVWTITCLLITSLVFLIFIIKMHEAQLEQERKIASSQVNSLFQVSLENAMLKRDLSGLHDIVRRLGEQDNISNVFILNPEGEVRFASNKKELSKTMIKHKDCLSCLDKQSIINESTTFLIDDNGNEILRSIKPVHNKQECVQCHGAVDNNPINGVLVVDYIAGEIREHTINSTLFMIGSGGVVVFIMVFLGWWLIRLFVLVPVSELLSASQLLSAGHLYTRVNIRGKDEIAHLGKVFNKMAYNLESNMELIKEKELFLQNLIDAIPDGIRVINKDYEIIMANRAYCRQLELSMDEVINNKCYISSHSNKCACPTTLLTCPLKEVSKNHTTVKVLHQHVRKDGSNFYAEIYAAPMYIDTDKGKVDYIVESIRDLAEQIKYSHEQKMATMCQLATGVAHEIRNPLSSIRIALQATLRSLSDNKQDYNKMREYLELVDNEIDKCIDITGRLLKLTKPVGEELELVSVNKAIIDILSLLDEDAKLHGINIIKQLNKPEVRVLSAESDIRIIIVNFVQNAFHAMPDGGELTVTCKVDKDKSLVIFSDTGVGITPEDMLRIYDPFYSSRANGKVGTGLGLTISKALVENHKGKIKVDSILGEGTTFTIILPNADI